MSEQYYYLYRVKRDFGDPEKGRNGLIGLEFLGEYTAGYGRALEESTPGEYLAYPVSAERRYVVRPRRAHEVRDVT